MDYGFFYIFFYRKTQKNKSKKKPEFSELQYNMLKVYSAFYIWLLRWIPDQKRSRNFGKQSAPFCSTAGTSRWFQLLFLRFSSSLFCSFLKDIPNWSLSFFFFFLIECSDWENILVAERFLRCISQCCPVLDSLGGDPQLSNPGGLVLGTFPSLSLVSL